MRYHDDRVYIPFDGSWRLPRQVRVSRAVRFRAVTATCGECDFDLSGNVVHPDDLQAQARAVSKHLLGDLRRINTRLADVARLEAFYSSDPHMHAVHLRHCL